MQTPMSAVYWYVRVVQCYSRLTWSSQSIPPFFRSAPPRCSSTCVASVVPASTLAVTTVPAPAAFSSAACRVSSARAKMGTCSE